MLRITTSHSAEGAKKYFDVSLKTSDYYTRDIGTWGGKGAEILRLKGEGARFLRWVLRPPCNVSQGRWNRHQSLESDTQWQFGRRV
jgi:hypothetical protein